MVPAFQGLSLPWKLPGTEILRSPQRSLDPIPTSLGLTSGGVGCSLVEQDQCQLGQLSISSACCQEHFKTVHSDQHFRALTPGLPSALPGCSKLPFRSLRGMLEEVGLENLSGNTAPYSGAKVEPGPLGEEM